METQDLKIPSISVRKIKTISLHLDEFDIPEDVIFKIDFSRTFNVDLKQELFFLNFEVRYSIPKDEFKKREVLKCEILNVFGVEGLNGFIGENGIIKFPIELLSSIVGLAITHCRAILSIYTAGTPLGETLLPVVNPTEVAKLLFEELM